MGTTVTNETKKYFTTIYINKYFTQTFFKKRFLDKIQAIMS